MKNTTKRRLEKKADCWSSIIARKIFNSHYYSGDLNKTCESIERYTPEIKKLIDYLEHCAIVLGWTTDSRKGEETYGYKSLEVIEGTLNYIADRFSSQHRLQWMLDVPQKVKELKQLE